MTKVVSITNYLEIIKNEFEKEKVNVFIYRGQPNSDWEVESAAVRRIRKSFTDDAILLDTYIRYHKRLIDIAKLKGYNFQGNKKLNDLELIAELQHYSAATCLIDFSRNPLIALWFACSNKFDKNGAVYVLNISNSKKFSQISYEQIEKHAIEDFLTGNINWYWEPSEINQRIPRQHSVFVFGPLSLDKKRFTTITIDKDRKLSILNDLDRIYNINQATLFSDLPGFAKANNVENVFSAWKWEDYYIYGLHFMQSLDYPKAIEYYTRAMELSINNAQLLEGRGITYFNNGQNDLAMADFNKGIEIDSRNSRLYFGRGMVKLKLNDIEGAISDYSKSIELDPKSSLGYHHRGLAKRTLGMNEEAIQDFDKAIELEPDYFQLYQSRALTFTLLNKPDKAVKDFDKAIELNPSLPELYKGRAIVKKQLGLDKDAIQDDKMANILSNLKNKDY